jgi:GxxExxY protein
VVDNKYKYSDITEKIIGCSLNIHKQLGNGFPEVIYQRCLEIEFKKSNLKFKKEFEIPVFYNNIEVGKRRADFIVENVVLVELKAIQNIDDYCISQVLNYLKAFKIEVGLLINFGEKSLRFKRLINTINKN